ncbi:hypothetical protein BpHYR1_016750 [Brachionus plicatilis]|uniref:Uncharacterized protein n=1 Tax=Brachionus plicatilis TaxID=10195 RepID=A0A3M7Q1H3_BRAPC|nr:hypothetical protein BpHYR1_016750 [Brachionus plicatilis]
MLDNYWHKNQSVRCVRIIGQIQFLSIPWNYFTFFALIICVFLRSPTLTIRHNLPSLWPIQAFLEKTNVSVRFFGLLNLAKTMPPMRL